jgi:hypothetical protein
METGIFLFFSRTRARIANFIVCGTGTRAIPIYLLESELEVLHKSEELPNFCHWKFFIRVKNCPIFSFTGSSS